MGTKRRSAAGGRTSRPRGSEPVKCVGVSIGVDIHNGHGVAVRVRHWADGKMDVEEVTEFNTRNAPNNAVSGGLPATGKTYTGRAGSQED